MIHYLQHEFIITGVYKPSQVIKFSFLFVPTAKDSPVIPGAGYDLFFIPKSVDFGR